MPGVAPLPTYSIVSPVRDEAEHLARTAEALVAQTHRPLQWVIVDDGSTDGTPDIAARYAAQHDWIGLVSAPGEHERARGAPIVRAFNHGRAQLTTPPEVLVKLDGDIDLPADYFASVCRTFADDPSAGIAGGVAYVPGPDGWELDNVNLATLRGVAKAYRVACLDAIGGLPESMGWDGIDEY